MEIRLRVQENNVSFKVTDTNSATFTAEQGIPIYPSDGNNMEYGLTDGTLPLVGVAKVGSAVI